MSIHPFLESTTVVLRPLPQACLQGGDYKQYLDYSKYTQGHGSQGGDFKQYMQSYGGDYSSKYTQGQGSQARWFLSWVRPYFLAVSKH